ncbi:UNVERIFIED_CONTAM: hypothetical protein PYX00_003753 [Menopon gallinae]|uniref:RNA-binding protein 5 n=1 Tax=Menopon gallinae TaxID=328185 RepID=A0AAW2I162_9NEOP
MNLWGRGSPRFPFIQPMQGPMEFPAYEQFPFQNPAWDVPHPAFAQNICGPVPASEIFYPERYGEVPENWNQNESSPKQNKEETTSHNFWQYKPPGTECDDESSDSKSGKKEFKEGKIAQYQNNPEHRRSSDKRERSEKHRDRDDRESERESRRSVEKEGPKDKEKRSRDRSRERKEKEGSEKDQFGRDVPRNSRRSSRERKERSPKEKRKRDDDDGHRRRDDSRHRDRDRDRDDDLPPKRHRLSNEPMDSKFSLEAANYKTQTPNETVMIRGLAQHITENDIRQDILQCGMMPKDIRLIRKKETGASRGFAFVEFNSTEEARYWMEMKQGVLMFQDQYRAIMQFSIISNDNLPSSVWMPPTDWDCPKCFAHNFKKRVSCFKCHAPRPEANDGLDCSNEISPHPTTKLILRNLDVLTNEETLLKEISNMSNIPIQSCQIARDTLTNLSRGICYLEMKNVLEAIKLYNALTASTLMVEGRKVSVSYCKLHLDKPQPQPSALTQSQWAACGISETDYKLEDVPRLAEYSAQMYATTPQEHAAYVQYYTQYYTAQISQGSNPVPQGTGANVAAAVAQSAIIQAQSKKAVISGTAANPGPIVPTTYLSSRQLIGNTSIGEPDVSSYSYDETSGYFFDQHTGLYYDATSQYYYHSQDQIFLYWDAEKRAYMPAPTDDKSGNQAKTDEGNKDDKKKDKDKDKGQDKVKVAKRIAKDMERWAKTLNQKKEVAKMNAVAIQQAQAAAKSASTADIAFAVLERKESSNLGFPDPAPPSEHAQSNLVASYGGGSDSDDGGDEAQSEDKFHTDWVKLACLLCKRQFPTKEALCRHQQLSDLHKQNLEAWYSSRGMDNAPQRMYRDRAKERREKFGIPDEPRPNRLKEKYLKEKEEIYEEPNRGGIPAENVGSKMLQKMGWTEGMGLGRSNQGRTDIIQANQRVPTAGLGASGSNLGTGSLGSTYKDNVKRSMMARYSELEG